MTRTPQCRTAATLPDHSGITCTDTPRVAAIARSIPAMNAMWIMPAVAVVSCIIIGLGFALGLPD
ncbi:hypothetical protein AAFP30_04105 [Gordonia sp. CPCC 205515]|uniref:hypothetical protein n=1 Tax=Gordonia sp. CPCC 205515 TaxID=3140791 RepID=UPI003AF33E5E